MASITLPFAVGMFLFAALLVIGSGIFLATSGDIIAEKSGWGRVWVGSLLVAGATSLPELVTNVTAVLLDSPALAAGNIFGANMLNMATLSFLVILLGGSQVFVKLLPLQVWVAGVALVMTTLATLMAVIGPEFKLFGIPPTAVIILGAYVICSRILRNRSSSDDEDEPLEDKEEHEEEDDDDGEHSLKWGVIVFSIASVIIFMAAPMLAFSSQQMAIITGVSEGFVGVLAVAIVTTLPEFTSAATAFRIGAPDLGVSAFFGSNAFNVAALGVADLAYTKGHLYASLDTSHVAAGLFAILLMSLAMFQLATRRHMAPFSLTQPSPVAIIVVYVIGLFIVFNLGLQV